MAVEEDLGVLVERARADDEDAWEALYRRVYPKLLAYATRRLDRDRAREAVSETMARAVAKLPRFTPRGGGFEAWLFGICRYVVLDAQRAAGRTGYGLPIDAVFAPQQGVDERLLRAEEAARVRAAFSRLSDDERELLELRVVAGLSSDAAASVLGKRPGAVRMAQSRALAKLRALLEEEGR